MHSDHGKETVKPCNVACVYSVMFSAQMVSFVTVIKS